MSENLGLGKIITTPQSRDAIHIAVVPVVAGESLWPGLRVKMQDGKAVRGMLNCIGIVDPFLPTAKVNAGDTFWLFLDPGSITSLRHVWTHPEFADDEEDEEEDEGEEGYDGCGDC